MKLRKTLREREKDNESLKRKLEEIESQLEEEKSHNRLLKRGIRQRDEEIRRLKDQVNNAGNPKLASTDVCSLGSGFSNLLKESSLSSQASASRSSELGPLRTSSIYPSRSLGGEEHVGSKSLESAESQNNNSIIGNGSGSGSAASAAFAGFSPLAVSPLVPASSTGGAPMYKCGEMIDNMMSDFGLKSNKANSISTTGTATGNDPLLCSSTSTNTTQNSRLINANSIGSTNISLNLRNNINSSTTSATIGGEEGMGQETVTNFTSESVSDAASIANSTVSLNNNSHSHLGLLTSHGHISATGHGIIDEQVNMIQPPIIHVGEDNVENEYDQMDYELEADHCEEAFHDLE